VDSSAFTTILERHGTRIFQYLRKLLRQSEDAEDICQNVFVAFYEKADGVHPEAVESYLYRAAYNQAINFLKSSRRKRETELPDTMQIAEPDTTEDPVQARKNAAIRDAFLNLNDNEASALHMQFYDNKSYRDIAGIMNMTESAVESLLVRAKRKMRGFLAQEMSLLGVDTEERGEK
jgi:RNA polymerase sigma-70 factor, ECF subfamily